MPDIKILKILQINCNTIGTKKEEKGVNYNQNKMNAINVGSEQCCTNKGMEKDCNKKDNDADSSTNTGNSLISNNMPHNASLPHVKDNLADYLLSGTMQTNNKIEYFLSGPKMWMTKEQVPA